MSSLSTNFENLENKLLDIPNNLVNYMKANNIANSIVLLILLYVILASPMLDPSLLSILNNMFFKILYVFLVMCLISRNPAFSLIVAVVLAVVLNYLIPCSTAHIIETGSTVASTLSGQTGVLPSSVQDTLSRNGDNLNSTIATISSGVVLPPNVVSDTLLGNDARPKSDKSNMEKFDDVVEPVNVQPVNVQPVNVQPVNVQPVNVEPVNVEPVNVQPVNVQPVNVEPVNVQPVNVQPVNVQPVNVQPVAEQVHNDERLTQRQQMNKLWTSINNKPNGLSENGANKCDSIHVNSACDVLGTNSMNNNNARVAGSNEPCPVDGEIVGFYENVDREYAEY